MIEFSGGDILACDVEALVNPVNTVGVMGKGLARAFRVAFPENTHSYTSACRAGQVRIGKMHVVDVTQQVGLRKLIVNFPTKEHYANPSLLRYIWQGLGDLIEVVETMGISSIAIPALGCGNGGLSWEGVLPQIRLAADAMPNTRVVVFPPVRTTDGTVYRG